MKHPPCSVPDEPQPFDPDQSKTPSGSNDQGVSRRTFVISAGAQAQQPQSATQSITRQANASATSLSLSTN